jgi:tRNA nucleotidyltransferase (CCA-adding enzyme)
MLESGILPVILPELMPSVGFEQNDFHHEDVFEHTLTVTERSVADLTVRLAALFHDVGKPATLTVDEEGHRHFYKHELESESMAVAAMERLKFSNAKIAAVRSLVKHHMRPIECGPSGVRRLLRDLDENFAQWRELKIADAPPLMPEPEFRQHLSDFDTMVETERTRRKGAVHEGLAIDGNDLMALGMAAGRPMGELLKALAEHVIENPDDNDREILLEKARRSISGPTH